MKASRSSFFLAMLVCMIGTVPVGALGQARFGVPIVNIENNVIVTSGDTELTPLAVAEAIRAAGASQGYPWIVSGESPGVMQLTTIVRGKHTVVVTVTFYSKAYSIRYASSINMNYKNRDGKEVIHPNYNVWVQQLKQAIDAQLKRLPGMPGVPGSGWNEEPRTRDTPEEIS